MSKADTAAAESPRTTPSPQYLDWLRQERRTRLTIRLTQFALLAAFLVLWEVLPRAGFIPELFLPSLSSTLVAGWNEAREYGRARLHVTSDDPLVHIRFVAKASRSSSICTPH